MLFAADPARPALLLPTFVLAEPGIGCGETAQSAALASLASEYPRGSAFGLLATVQAVGNLIASVVAGLLWSAVSPLAAFAFLAAAMVIAAALIATAGRGFWPGCAVMRNRASGARRQARVRSQASDWGSRQPSISGGAPSWPSISGGAASPHTFALRNCTSASVVGASSDLKSIYPSGPRAVISKG